MSLYCQPVRVEGTALMLFDEMRTQIERGDIVDPGVIEEAFALRSAPKPELSPHLSQELTQGASRWPAHINLLGRLVPSYITERFGYEIFSKVVSYCLRCWLPKSGGINGFYRNTSLTDLNHFTLPMMLLWASSQGDMFDKTRHELDRYSPGWRNELTAIWADDTTLPLTLWELQNGVRSAKESASYIHNELGEVRAISLKHAISLFKYSVANGIVIPVPPKNLMTRVLQAGLSLETVLSGEGTVQDYLNRHDINKASTNPVIPLWKMLFLRAQIKPSAKTISQHAEIIPTI